VKDLSRNCSIQKKKIKYDKLLPAITTKNIIITGDLKISEMICNPAE
jgi:hypothetical protein